MEITVFRNVAGKKGETLVSLRDFAQCITHGVISGKDYREVIAGIRKAAGEGRSEEVRLLKMRLPAVTFAGNCMEGRFYPTTTHRTGLAMFDIDKIPAKLVEEAKIQIQSYPWVAMTYTTCSGLGLRVVANIGLVHIDVYRDAYEIVADTIARITGLELDMQCKDFGRLSMFSYDPDVFLNPSPEVFPYSPANNPLNYKPYFGPDTSEDFRMPVLTDEACTNLAANAARNVPPKNINVDYVAAVDRFFSINQYAEGSRHGFLLRLGGYLRWRGLGSEDVYSAIDYICTLAAGNGMNRPEIKSAVTWGYANGSEAPKDNIMGVGTGAEYRNRVKKVKKVNNDPISDDDDDILAEEIETENEVICRLCPTIPDDVFESLPGFIKEIALNSRTTRERDVLLLSTIVNLSAVFSNIRSLYADVWYSPHLYFCVAGGAGSGKGKAMAPARLCSVIEKEFEKEYRSRMSEYREKLSVWEVEQRRASKEMRTPDFSLCPDEPVRKNIIMQSTTSKSRMLHLLKINEAKGMVMNTSELDNLSSSLNADYGRHTSFFRSIFHHESLGQDFKIDSGAIVVERPSLACNISATFGQLVTFINNIEDGMYSRFLFYLLPTLYEWVSPAPGPKSGKSDFDSMMSDKAMRLKEYFFKYNDNIVVEFTDEQWAMHNRTFGGMMKSLEDSDKDGVKAIVARAGLISCRIAMTLCGVQIMEAGWKISNYVCPDEIMKAAIEITKVCFRHSLHLTTIFRSKENRGKIRNFNREDEILSLMPREFSFTEFVDRGVRMGFSKSSIKYDLRKLLHKGSVQKDTVVKLYRKTKKSSKKGHY